MTDRVTPRRNIAFAMAAMLLAFWTVGCGDTEPPPPDPPRPTLVTVSPASATLTALEATVHLTAVVHDQYGQVMTGAAVTWTSGDATVASVDGSGLIIAAGNGMAVVMATSGEASGNATVTVEQKAAEVLVSPDSVALFAFGDTVQLAAEAQDVNGHVVAHAEFDWSSIDSVTTVDTTGLVTAVGNGTAVVRVTSGEASGNATVTVEQRVVAVRVSPDSVALAAVGDTVRLVAEALDANGHEVATAEFAWSGADSVATVDGSGLVTAVGNGTAAFTATTSEAFGSATVTVEQRVAVVRVSSDSVTLIAIGDTVRLAAEALDANGHPVAHAEFAWSSADSVAIVDESGLVTAVGNGTAAVKATSGEGSGSATVTVQQRVVAVHVSPDSVTLFAIGDTVRLAAEAVDANSHAVANAEFDWSSADAVATVNRSGLLTAVGNGTAVVTATSGESSGSATVTVGQRVVAVRVSPQSVTLFAIGDTVRLVAEALDANSHAVANAEFDWSSADAVATVDGFGLVTAVGNGTAVLTATSGESSGTATVTVEQKVVAVRVSPQSVTLFAIGDTVELAAEALDVNGVTVVNAGFEWSSDNAVVRVDDSGVVTAVSEGNATVTATSGKVSGSAAVRVTVLTGPAMDRAILGVFYEATAGPSWSNNENWLTDAPLDDWHGVRTDHEGRVVELELIANDLEGYLPPELGRLDQLRHLLLDAARAFATTCFRPTRPASTTYNGESGDWPGYATETDGRYARSWVRRTEGGRTRGVDMGVDRSVSSPGTSATLRQAAGNRLVGRIPPELGDLANLETLRLNLNQLSGPIPPELGRLANLRTLWLVRNRLTGSIPPELGQLRNLESLDLATTYDLSQTPPRPRYALSGPLPPELGNLANLEELDLFGHKFTGSIPPELARLAKLGFLDLTCNALAGPVPPVLRQFRDLRDLSIWGNLLHGEIPAWLGELAHLESLSFGVNYYLTGRIPPSVGRLTELEQLSLGFNLLSGPIPPELGDLAKLEDLGLRSNRLTGALPPQLGQLTNLGSLELAANRGLAGTLPRGLIQTSLWRFHWGGTDLCAPRDRAFQTWLSSILNHRPGQNCTLPSREVFATFYEATGGSGWTSSGNWLTDAPVSSWFGVTVENRVLTALELPGNGLSGVLPPAVGDFVDLKRLDVGRNALTSGMPPDLGDLTELRTLNLSNNRFSGLIPRELARLGALNHLDLSDNELEGALPGALTNLESLSDFNWSGSGACAPEVAWFQTWLESVATTSGPTCEGPFSLSVEAAHLSQAAQSIGGAVPLIAGRPALARILATADRANELRPNARAVFLLDGREVHLAEMVLGSPRGLAEHLPGQLDQWYNAVIPAELLRPGLEMAVRVDPDSTISRNPLGEVRVSPDMREMPPLELTIVPVVTGSSSDTTVLEWIRNADDAPVEFMRAVLPVGELDLTIREPLTIADAPEAASFDDWLALLEDIALLRATEDGTGYWYAVVNREGDAGIAGIAFVEGWAGAGIPDAEVFAHELGHNMSLTHAPCGFPGGVDPDFPYPDGNIGVVGYDPRSGAFVDPSTPDLMSYCRPQWISDYNLAKALEYRIREEGQPRAPAAQVEPGGSRLLLRGHVTEEGALHLDPAFALDAPARLPSAPGPYRIEGFAGDGNRVFALDFDMETVSEGGGGFLFLVPLAEDRIASLERIALTGPEGSTALDRETRVSPVAIVIDRETGRIRSILRGEAAGAAIGAAAADRGSGAVPGARVLISQGLPGKVP